MKISDEGIQLILKYEDFHRTVILDAIGIKTVGIGHTTNAKKLKVGAKIAPERVWQWFVNDLNTCYNTIENEVKVELTQYEFDALVAFCFNVGSYNFQRSTLLKLLNSNADRDKVAAQFHRWTRAGGKVLKGLERRRADEANMFLNNPIFV